MAILTVTGKTWEHRETLKSFGNWNPANKSWTIKHATPEMVERIKALPGVNVVSLPEPNDAQPMTEVPAALAPIERPRFVPQRSEPIIHGDDQTYFGAFKDKPTQFAGFSSLDQMANFVAAIDKSKIPYSNDRRCAWDIGSDWIGTKDMQEALSLAHNGWAKGIDMAKDALEIIESDHAEAKKRSYSVAGGRVNIGKMLSGSPLHMSHRTRQPARKVITLYVNFRISSGISTTTAAIRAASVAAIADILEANDYSCEIVAFRANTASGLHSQTVVTLKHAGEKLNLNDIVFALGHPSMTRRLSLAINAIDDEMASFCRSAYGFKTHDPFNELKANEFIIDEPTANVKGNDFRASVRALFPLIVPDNFPVSLK